jgi:hypothetical protein
MYWVPMEITGSNEGTLKDPKFSLLDWFQKKEIPRLEAVGLGLGLGLGETAIQPSLLSRHHTPATPQPPTKSKAKATTKFFNTPTLIRLCHQTTSKGWLRSIHSLSMKKQLNKDEKSLCITLFIALRVVADSAGALVGHAWGVRREIIFKWYRKTNINNMDFTRKVRKDKGETVFTSHARRIATFTPQHAFDKKYRAQKHLIVWVDIGLQKGQPTKENLERMDPFTIQNETTISAGRRGRCTGYQWR